MRCENAGSDTCVSLRQYTEGNPQWTYWRGTTHGENVSDSKRMISSMSFDLMGGHRQNRRGINEYRSPNYA